MANGSQGLMNVNTAATGETFAYRTPTGQVRMADGVESNDGFTVGQAANKFQINTVLGTY